MKVFNLSEQLADLYLEFLNNYLTVDKFAEHYQISEQDAVSLLSMGKEHHNNRVDEVNGVQRK